MGRLGKIARLPRAVREELNQRLADGEMGRRLVDWLNSLPETQKVVASEFGGRAINEQNLTEWKQGGFEDWQRHHEARAWVTQLVEQSDDLEAESGLLALADRAAVPMVVALTGVLKAVAGSADPAEQRKAVLGVAQQLTQLRRGNHEAERVRIERERWEAKKEDRRREDAKAAENGARFKRISAAFFPHLDEDGIPLAKGSLPPELQSCLEANSRLRGAQPTENQTESN